MSDASALPKTLRWIASSKRDFDALPRNVVRQFGHALYLAQVSERHPHAKAMKHMGGGVFEIIEDDEGGTYRAVYTVRFALAVYVLHAFQKKSKHGIATPKEDIEKIKARLKLAEQDYKRRHPDG